MRPQRSCTMKTQYTLLNYFKELNENSEMESNNSLLKDDLNGQMIYLDSYSNDSEDSIKVDKKENVLSKFKKKFRTKVNQKLISNIKQSDVQSGKHNSSLFRKRTIVDDDCNSKKKANKVVEDSLPSNSPKRQYLRGQHSALSHRLPRYPLRSRDNFNESVHLFRTPDPPNKRYFELFNNITPNDKNSILNLSHTSGHSLASSGGLSALVSARFMKKNKRLTNVETIKKRKFKRLIDASVDYADCSSCLSTVDIQNSSILDQESEKKILDLCNQTEIIGWSSYFEEQSVSPVCKLGEGVYGEVFRLSNGNVLKVFPVDGDIVTNGENQMTMDDVFPEVFVSNKLTELNNKEKLYRTPNFVQLKNAALLHGKLPNILVEQWNRYKHENGSENECLDFLPKTQKWISLEFEFAGEPLSEYKFPNYSKTRGLIEQIAMSLAVAEASLQFEHRDLHWQNILIKPTKLSQVTYMIDGFTYFAKCYGIFASIIDFTVARMSVSDGDVVYMDMADCPEIFEGEGDYQFDIYRMMKTDNNNNWLEYHPRSNLYWLHYLIDKLLHETSYRRGDPRSSSIQLELSELYSSVLSYNSVRDLIDHDTYFKHCSRTRFSDDSSI